MSRDASGNEGLPRPLACWSFRGKAASTLCLCLLTLSIGLIGCGGGSGSNSSSSSSASNGSTALIAPTITTQPSAQTVGVGSTASFSVTTAGLSVTYQWYKDGTAISGATSATYSITAVTATDAGSYYVITTNAAGSIQSNSVALTISSVNTGDSSVTVQ